MTFTPLKGLQILALLFLIILVGIVGYHTIEGWPWFDALYMTVITLATVGYGEIHPLSFNGRLFTVFLIIGGMGILLYGVTELTAFLVEGEMTGFLRRRRMNKNIQKMSNHYILCGWGLKGRHVLEELLRTRRNCVVVENNAEKIQKLSEMKVLVVEGDATQDSTLKAAGIERAAGLITALPTDKDNLFVLISARGLNKNIRIVAKVDEMEAREKFLRSGANAAVSGNYIAGLRMASEMIRPDAVTFLDSMLRDNSQLRVEDVIVGEGSKFVGKTLSSCDPLQDARVLLFSVKRNGEYQFNPSGSTHIHGGDTLIVIGYPEQISTLRSAFNPS